MAQKIRAEYDFTGMSGTGELNMRQGEILTILRQGIEGGWIEAKNEKGKVGLVPETYISHVGQASVPPTTAPPPLPSTMPIPSASCYSVPSASDNIQTTSATSSSAATKTSTLPSAPSAPSTWDSWGEATTIAPSYQLSIDRKNSLQTQQLPTEAQTSYPKLDSNLTMSDNWSDDDWSDEDEEVAEFTNQTTYNSMNTRPIANRSRSTGPESTSSMSLGKSVMSGTARMKNINRFSNFVKTGMESYILAISKMSIQPGECHEIVMNGNKIEWRYDRAKQYTCTIDKPKKESKLKGLKSFIAYSLVCSLSGIQVSRRYKHFDWLHEQLSNKYILIPIPPLPEKQVSGRYEEDLIEHRRSILQIWIDKLCAHPVLSQSEVWKHFMSCTDEKRWKNGKRLAEKDEYVGGNFFNCVTAPSELLDSTKLERQIDSYSRHIRNLEESYRNLFDRISEMQKQYIGPYKVNHQKLASAFELLAQSLDSDNLQPNYAIANAVKTSAHVLHKIGTHYEEHGKKEVEQFLDYLYVNKGFVVNIPDIINVHKSSITKLRENERLQNEGKISSYDSGAIRRRVDVITYSMLAEINHISSERDRDIQKMFGDFFALQAEFHGSIAKKMTELSDLFRSTKL